MFVEPSSVTLSHFGEPLLGESSCVNLKTYVFFLTRSSTAAQRIFKNSNHQTKHFMEANEGSAKSIGWMTMTKGSTGVCHKPLNSLRPHSIVSFSPTSDTPKNTSKSSIFFLRLWCQSKSYTESHRFLFGHKKTGSWFWEIVHPNKVTQVGQCLVVHFMKGNNSYQSGCLS